MATETMAMYIESRRYERKAVTKILGLLLVLPSELQERTSFIRTMVATVTSFVVE